jgi:hypothetical protein
MRDREPIIDITNFASSIILNSIGFPKLIGPITESAVSMRRTSAAGARTDRVDMAPIIFGLRMDARVAVDLGGRGLQDLGLYPLGKAQHVDRAVHAGLGGLHRIVLVMHGRGRTGEIVDLIDFEINRKRDVVPDQFEALVAEKMFDVALGASEKIIKAEHIGAAGQQAFAEMRTEKTRSSGHQNALLKMHYSPRLFRHIISERLRPQQIGGRTAAFPIETLTAGPSASSSMHRRSGFPAPSAPAANLATPARAPPATKIFKDWSPGPSPFGMAVGQMSPAILRRRTAGCRI